MHMLVSIQDNLVSLSVASCKLHAFLRVVMYLMPSFLPDFVPDWHGQGNAAASQASLGLLCYARGTIGQGVWICHSI